MAKRDPQPVEEPVDEWQCTQPGCTRPLEAHIVTLADKNMKGRKHG